MTSGNTIGFFEWLHNSGSSNISQLYVNEITGDQVYKARYWIADSNNVTVLGPVECPTATPLACSFGALNAGYTVYLLAALVTPANAQNGTPYNATFDFNTTGTPPGKNNSHGDAINRVESITLVSTKNGDAAGNFFYDQIATPVADNQKVNGNNPQATSGSVGASQVGLYVADGTAVDQSITCDASFLPQPPPDWFSCANFTSQWSELQVRNGTGNDFRDPSGHPGIKLVVTFQKLPSGLTGTHPAVYHLLTYTPATSSTPASGTAELIDQTCTYDSSGALTSTNQCFTVDTVKNAVTVYLFHNGYGKF